MNDGILSEESFLFFFAVLSYSCLLYLLWCYLVKAVCNQDLFLFILYPCSSCVDNLTDQPPHKKIYIVKRNKTFFKKKKKKKEENIKPFFK